MVSDFNEVHAQTVDTRLSLLPPTSLGTRLVCVIKKEAVILSATVAQKPISVFTIPYSLVSLMFISMAEVTVMNFL